MAACRFVALRAHQLFDAGKNESFMGVTGAQWRILPIAAVLQCAPRLPPPIFSIFSSVRSGQGAGQQQSFCAVRGLLSEAIFFLLVVSSVSEYKAKQGIWLLVCILPRPLPALMDAGYLWNRVQCNIYTLAKSGPYAVQEKLALDCIAKKAICLSYLKYRTVFAS